jgi:(S)-ureidoglycine aminohydrolase
MTNNNTGPHDARSYYSALGGLPPQTELLTGRAIFTEAYAVIPKGVMSDIVTSYFPNWDFTRGWVLARPLSGFAETFSQIIMEIGHGGGSDQPEDNPQAECVIFVVEGALELSFDGMTHLLSEGSYAYLPAGLAYSIRNRHKKPAKFHWVRKRYQPVAGLEPPPAFVTSDRDHIPNAMPDTNGVWATTRFVDPHDLRHDMHVNIVTFQPGGVIPFAETHVMEHGLYVLEGKAVYRLNGDWVEVEAGDFMWLRAFCPQACYAGGPGPFRYLLYKDVNRLPALGSKLP